MNQAITLSNAPKALLPQNFKAYQRLLPEEQKFIEAALQPAIQVSKPLTVQEEIVKVLTSIYTIAGQQFVSETLVIYAREFYSRLLRTYPTITVEEIKIALQKGVYEEFGEYYGLNPKSFFFFVTSYLTSNERMNAKNEFEKNLLSPSVVSLSPEEQEKDNKEFINYLFNQHKEGKVKYETVPVIVYDFLVSIGRLDLCKEKKQALFGQAKGIRAKQLSDKVSELKFNRFNADAADISKLLQDFASGMMPDEEKEKVVIISKQLAAFEYLDDHLTWEVETIFEDVL